MERMSITRGLSQQDTMNSKKRCVCVCVCVCMYERERGGVIKLKK